ncbi:MAG TPA: bifunctional 3'-5' exonuclease/DNA polymerase, partial [Amnibacterium sp.]|nr:bifunctional 3'-5' exonuclease/DNA polymerase [Amnibacterium sp.]
MTLTTAQRERDGAAAAPAHVVIDVVGERIRVRALDAADRVTDDRLLPPDGFAALAAEWESGRPRWVWDTAAAYPGLLAAGVRVERCYDLRLARAILRRAAATAERFADVAGDGWDDLPAEPRAAAVALFGLEPEQGATDALAEFERQTAAVEAATRPGAL